MDTIFALSSGRPPAGIGIIRISGPAASGALQGLAGELPEPRRATLRRLREPGGILLDEAVVLWLPGPRTVSGEDMVELHCHGGRAVIDAVHDALGAMAGLRPAEPGEFTRRAFANGRIDLAQAEGLGDLLSAETELQRRAAIGATSGVLSREIENWRKQLLQLSAQVEAVLDFSDEDDVADLPQEFTDAVCSLAGELRQRLERPRAEKLRDGVRIVLAGPPNSGKSSLFNALTDSEAAITAPIAGTTRDVIERPVAIGGVPFLFVDTAGLRAETQDTIEAIGIDRAQAELARADIVIWLGPEGEGPEGAWEVGSFADTDDFPRKDGARHRVSAATGENIDNLRLDLIDTARNLLPKPGETALNDRQYGLVDLAQHELEIAATTHDPLLVAEQLRIARTAFDRLLGHSSTEDMLDALFGRFCIGK